MPLIEKEIIGPATHWYRDESTGLPRKLVVTPELTKHWHDQGNAMLSAGLTVPVPCEHDFDAHPMTPADKLKNNAGWVKEYKLKGDVLFGVVDIQDDEIAKKLPKTIRWSSPWINSFTDGQGKDWKNVISHLALTTRPRIIKQAPFGSIAAALSIATPADGNAPKEGFCLSKAGRLVQRKKGLRPEYPMAFSLYGGVKLSEDDPFMVDDEPPEPGKEGGEKPKKKEGEPEGDNPFADQEGDIPPPAEGDTGDSIPITELLTQLLPVIGVQMPDPRFITTDTFMRELLTAMISKVTQMAGAQQQQQPPQQQQQPNNQQKQPQQNPLITQEQQPMYMSLEDIQKIADPTMKNVALSMYNENVKLRGELDVTNKATATLRDAKLKEENAKRTQRVTLLGKLSPKVKADLDAMLALPSMALSMGDGGAVNDPLAQTLAVLEKGLADMPRLLTLDSASLSQQPQPTDADMLDQAATDKLADDMARMMGCAPEKKAG